MALTCTRTTRRRRCGNWAPATIVCTSAWSEPQADRESLCPVAGPVLARCSPRPHALDSRPRWGSTSDIARCPFLCRAAKQETAATSAEQEGDWRQGCRSTERRGTTSAASSAGRSPRRGFSFSTQCLLPARRTARRRIADPRWPRANLHPAQKPRVPRWSLRRSPRRPSAWHRTPAYRR